MRIRLTILAVAAALTMPFCAAEAATYTVNFTSTNIGVQSGPGPAPGGSVEGTFTLDFTPGTASHGQVTSFSSTQLSGFALNNIGFDYNGSGSLQLGYMSSSSDPIGTVGNAGTGDFYLLVSGVPGTDSHADLVYTLNGSNSVYYSFNTTATVAATPIPASLPLMGTGLLALVGFGYMRSKRNAGLTALAA